jgi:hypothetical protein
MPIPADRRRSHLAREVATLALSCVQVDNPMARVRAAVWSNAIARLGVRLPLFVVHDLGVLLTTPRGSGWVLKPADDVAKLGGPREAKALLEAYRRLVTTVAASDVVDKLAGMRLRDELIGVLLTRILGDTFHRWREREHGVAAPLPLDLGLYTDVDPLDHWKDFDAKPLWSLLGHLGEHALHVLTSVELIDLDTVRLLGMFKDGAGDALGGAVDLVDLFAALGSPEAHDVANFSLELLPSVLETRRATAVQTYAVDGYASIERKGNVDSLVLSELAYDREIFEQKVVDQELLYYGRERQREEERRLQYVLIDSSASMRGQRHGVRPRAGGGAAEEADLAGRRGVAAVLRLAAARDDQDRALGPGAGAVPPVVQERARPQLRQGVPPARHRAGPGRPRSPAADGGLHRHPRPVPPAARGGDRAGQPRVPLRHHHQPVDRRAARLRRVAGPPPGGVAGDLRVAPGPAAPGPRHRQRRHRRRAGEGGRGWARESRGFHSIETAASRPSRRWPRAATPRPSARTAS